MMESGLQEESGAAPRMPRDMTSGWTAEWCLLSGPGLWLHGSGVMWVPVCMDSDFSEPCSWPWRDTECASDPASLWPDSGRVLMGGQRPTVVLPRTSSAQRTSPHFFFNFSFWPFWGIEIQNLLSFLLLF